MGERHLVYIRVGDTMYRNYQEDEIYYNRNVIGLHIQWLLGYNAFNCLVNMIDFHNKNIVIVEGKKLNSSPFQLMASDFLYRQDPGKKYTNAEKVLQALYHVCPITGFWETSAKVLERNNFFYHDNNTGVTVVDFLDFENPKYCFINPGTAFVNRDVNTLESGVPLDAKTYLTAFGNAPKGWDKNHLQGLFRKISDVPLLTKEQLYDIFLPQKSLADAPKKLDRNKQFYDRKE